MAKTRRKRKAPAKKKAAGKAGSKKAAKKAAGKKRASKGARQRLTKQDKIGLLRRMMEIRGFEDKVFELLGRNVLKGASHVSAGQEAVPVGACSAITDRDYVTSTHRGHGHCLALGGDLKL
ncbi:MAG: thiamine pyrophosphate-dependent enzyme, partial [Planctomycetota bacterium]|nr:thiamine pyrophosphate-dependent enzyme [Planctomycetota bacterium]